MIGAVVIGRNEGQRLISCLGSLTEIEHIVYVDSGSTDGSARAAELSSAVLVKLDMSVPFTAARARNVGAKKLLELWPQTEFIQFVDGDCELRSGWLAEAARFLINHENFAAVCGRRRERYPNASVYNKLCDIEWNTPVGETKAFGGDVLLRVSAFNSIKGYKSSLIAGEEPEMCFRLRQLGWKIMRLDLEMTLHDASMMNCKQWFKRSIRAGYAYAESFTIHVESSEGFRRKEVISIVCWAFIFPLLILVLCLLVSPIYLILILIYPVQIFRLTKIYNRSFKNIKNAFFYAVSNVLSKWPQMIGLCLYLRNRINGQNGHIIEYK